MAPFYGWGSTGSRLEPIRGSSLLSATKFPEIQITDLCGNSGGLFLVYLLK